MVSSFLCFCGGVWKQLRWVVGPSRYHSVYIDLSTFVIFPLLFYFCNGYHVVLSGKFSKSQGVGINGKQAKETNIPVEVWRYYLLCNRPEVSDTRFCWDDLQAKLNPELIANLRNYVNRVLRFLAKPPGQGYGSIIPDITGAESDELTQNFGERIGEYVDLYVEDMEKRIHSTSCFMLGVSLGSPLHPCVRRRVGVIKSPFPRTFLSTAHKDCQNQAASLFLMCFK
ncbi:hypothetical protein Cgig2_008878 [Carnegiea gigantea]|uniref:Methionyl/Leucyl tRNA synthetase domain-containing protein n=1 Tax=Carnegiea gigantea TaxID=171969 RepID=A0A9Q1JNR3_9CARY|nr:hypothetical protein Cgig2_029435 [Carnegiea gigantea]KAJ8427518.1 hypothetical protein Cgig2_008878 [Carnegiea gigantea]